MTMRRLWGLLVLAGSTACSGAGEQTAGPTQGELTIQLLAQAIANADTATVLDIFWPEATYDDFANQQSHQGIQEIVAYVMSTHAWGDDVYMNMGRIHLTLTGAVGEWVFSAVQNRPLDDRIPEGTGREVVLNGVTVIEMEGDRIIRAADYTDTAPLLLQLGSRIELPGGQIIELDDPGR
jgi:hypothetical protein